MFIGLSSINNMRNVSSYADAQKSLAAAQLTPTGRPRRPKHYGYPLGGHSKSVTWVRQDDDGDIIFRLYDTDVVLWHPDNSFDVENFGTKTTASFADGLIPAGFHLSHPVCIQGIDGGYVGMTFRDPDADPDADYWSQSRICGGAVNRFLPKGDGWELDLSINTPMVFPELDRKKAAAITKECHIKDFETWLSVTPHMTRIEHDEWNVDRCSDALKAREFMDAAMHMPVMDCEKDAYGRSIRDYALPIVTRSRFSVVTMGCVNKLKTALWDWDGAFDDITVHSLPRKEFDRRMGRVKALRNMGCTSYDQYGPER